MLTKALNAKLKKIGKEDKGFTLIELLAVIVILGIIAVIAVPMISNLIGKSKDGADASTARQVYEAARMYVISEKNGVFKDADGKGLVVNVGTATDADTIDTLRGKGYLDKNLVLPSNKESVTAGKVTFAVDGTLTGDNAVEITTAKGTLQFKADDVMKATAAKGTAK